MFGLNDSDTMENLLSLKTGDLSRYLRRAGLSLWGIDAATREKTGVFCKGVILWTVTRGRSEDNPQRYQVDFSIERDSVGLFVRLSCVISLQRTSYRERIENRFYLVRKESNLLPGCYRYYFRDPYSRNRDGICSKLYFFRRGFVTRTALQGYGMRYKLQRDSHISRSVWTPYNRIPDHPPRYIKKHYRGKETPRFKRYRESLERAEENLALYTFHQMKKDPIFSSFVDEVEKMVGTELEMA